MTFAALRLNPTKYLTGFKSVLVVITLSLLSAHSLTAQAAASDLNNKASLKGLSEIYTLYDVRKANPKAMLSYLKGIESNYNNLIKENVKPHFRIIFISSAVQFITTHPSDIIEMEYSDTLKNIAKQITRLKNIGVKMEACATAMAYFKVDNDTLLPGITPVRSGFIAVMGWQAQGYSLVPIY